MSVRLGGFMERSGVLPTTQYAYRKGLGTLLEKYLIGKVWDTYTAECIGELAGGSDRAD